MEIFSGKTIILGAPKHFNLDKVIENELLNLGFNVINISFYNNQFSYKNFSQRIVCFFMKNVLWKRNYKTTIAFNNNKGWIEDKLKNIAPANYALIIRPDFYPIKFIAELHKSAKKLVAYQWDGINKVPFNEEYISLFERFFVFDKNDLSIPSTLPTTNFYPIAFETNLKNEELQSDVYYSGNLKKERLSALEQIIKDCKLLKKKVIYHLYHRKKKNGSITLAGLTISNQQLDYRQNLVYTYNTKTILDLVSPAHEGLSLRVFEAIGFEKKLITTNANINKYDFYHPDNIFIWNNSKLEELKAFIEKPYFKLPLQIKEKYSFKNWIKYLLNEGQYTTLNIPE